MTHDSFSARLRAVEQLLRGQDPEPGSHLVTVVPGDLFHRGTTTRPIQQRMWTHPSGLLLPETVAAQSDPLNDMRVYLTAEETLGRALSVEELSALFEQMSCTHAVRFAAHWLAECERPGRTHRQVDSEFVDRYLAEPNRTRVVNTLRDPQRVLVVPQALTFVARLALLASPDELAASSREPAAASIGDRLPVLATLGITDYLSAHVGEDLDGIADDETWTVTEVPGVLGRDLIANQLFNASTNLLSAWAVFQRCWRELPSELSEDPRIQVDLPEEYERATGVQLEDLVTLCGVLWSASILRSPNISDQYLEGIPWDRVRLEDALALFSADRSQMRQMLEDEHERFPGAWSTRTLDQYPVIRFDGGLAVLSPTRLARRSTGMWPMFDILRSIERQDRKLASKIRSTVAYAHEVWTLEGVANIVADPTRFYAEKQLRQAFPQGPVCDAALDYGDAWVLVEVTTTGMQSATAAGISDDAVVQDINDCVKKARQIDATISNLRADETRLTKRRVSGARQYFPVLVVTSRFAANPILMALLWERLDAVGLLQGEDVSPLEVLELEDLDVVEGLIEQGGPDFRTLLQDKAMSAYRGAAMHQYVLLGLRTSPKPPERVRSRWHTHVEVAGASLGVA